MPEHTTYTYVSSRNMTMDIEAQINSVDISPRRQNALWERRVYQATSLLDIIIVAGACICPMIMAAIYEAQNTGRH